MKTKILILLAVAAIMATPARSTTVLFPLQVMTGSRVSRPILIQPDLSTNQLVNSTNIVGQTPMVILPTNGIGRAVLLPWSYTVRVDGWPRSFHIVVPDSTNVLSAASLITNSVSVGSPNIFGLSVITTSNSASVTFSGNGTSTNPLTASTSGWSGSVTNISISYLPSVLLFTNESVSKPNSVSYGLFTNISGIFNDGFGDYTNVWMGKTNSIGGGHFFIGLSCETNGVPFEPYTWFLASDDSLGTSWHYNLVTSLTVPLTNWITSGSTTTNNCFVRFFPTASTNKNITTFINGLCITNYLQ